MPEPLRWNPVVFINGKKEPSNILIDTVLIIVVFQEGIQGFLHVAPCEASGFCFHC